MVSLKQMDTSSSAVRSFSSSTLILPCSESVTSKTGCFGVYEKRTEIYLILGKTLDNISFFLLYSLKKYLNLPLVCGTFSLQN